jgi:hypothetical protein
MWNLAKTGAIVAVCLAVVEVATAAAPAAVPRYGPFVHVTVPRKPVRLGEVTRSGMQQVKSHVTARVVANCPYQIEASFEGLRHEQGKAVIAPKHLSIAINGKPTPIGKGRVTIAQSRKPTKSTGEDVPVDLQIGVKNLPMYPAGRYSGTLVITVMAGP